LTDEMSAPHAAVMSAGDLSDPTRVIADNLRRLRRRQGLSIERLAASSGVSRSAISDIERGRTAPTINLVDRLARALRVDFSALVGEPQRRATVQRRCDEPAGRARWLSPRRAHTAGFFQVRVAARSRLELEVPDGGVHNVLVAEGRLAIELDDAHYNLGTGDVIQFHAHAPCACVNGFADDAVLYVVVAPEALPA
jgi:transcriptional regulator with XRE-family HTH domain